MVRAGHEPWRDSHMVWGHETRRGPHMVRVGQESWGHGPRRDPDPHVVQKTNE